MTSLALLSRAAFAGAAALLAAVGPVRAAQFIATADFNAGSSVVTSYVGPGSFANPIGMVNDGGRDAFDGYGRYSGGAAGVTLQRQSELISGENIFRFLDSFTNSTADTITFDVDFVGVVGSDVLTTTFYDQGGVMVTCQVIGGACTHDAVIAHVAGTRGLLSQTIGGVNKSRYDATYRLTLTPGQTASLLNFAFLASDLAGTKPTDVTLATDTGKLLAGRPLLDGLSDGQIASITNFDLGETSAVPEPAVWATMLFGFVLVGGSLRRRRATSVSAGA